LHRSRLPAYGGDPDDCLLETWYEQGIDEGGRVRKELRFGVKAALEILASGFLRHSANDPLRAKLGDGRLTEVQLYRELLNLIYRLLFLVVAEERRLLFVPDADSSARHEVYLRWYGIGRLRERAEKRAGDDGYCDLWEGLKETFRLFATKMLPRRWGSLPSMANCSDSTPAPISKIEPTRFAMTIFSTQYASFRPSRSAPGVESREYAGGSITPGSMSRS
jgi:hypothetical protein